MNFRVEGRQFLVIGAGKTGESVARFLVRQHAAVRITDKAPTRLAAVDLPSTVERCGDDDDRVLEKVEAVIPSPGVARNHRLLVAALERGLPVLSEIELAFRFLRCPLIAITGTNGKSTTTTLIAEMFRHAGKRIFVGGNLGTPLIEACSSPALDLAVVEVSSFQLEWVSTFRPQVAVLLNLTPDHLDRYADLAEYQRAKAAIFRMMEPEDTMVLNRDDPWVWQQRTLTRARVVSFGGEPVEFGTFVAGEDLTVWITMPSARKFSLARTQLLGAHNRQNIMAAATAAVAGGCPDAAIQQAIDETRGLPHRLAPVRERDGVRFFDDSKGTNVGAVLQSVASFPHGVILLAGGYDKGGDFSELLPVLRQHAKCVVAFGAAGALVERQLGPHFRVERAQGLEHAVQLAADIARPGDVVLLSPGCASFDEFRDYAHRGDRFREIVEAL